MEHKLNIVNKHLKFQKVSLVEPSKSFYLHIAAEIDHSPFPFFLSTSSKKKQIVEQSKNWCNELRKDNDIITAVVFKARLIPPGQGEYIKQKRDEVHIAKFDLLF
jgi:hypothetical protein